MRPLLTPRRRRRTHEGRTQNTKGKERPTTLFSRLFLFVGLLCFSLFFVRACVCVFSLSFSLSLSKNFFFCWGGRGKWQRMRVRTFIFYHAEEREKKTQGERYKKTTREREKKKKPKKKYTKRTLPSCSLFSRYRK